MLSNRTTAAARVLYALVDSTVAIVVLAITYLPWNRAAAAARVLYALVDPAVAIVVLAITDLPWNWAAAAARVLHALVDLTVAVIVEAVTRLEWHRPTSAASHSAPLHRSGRCNRCRCHRKPPALEYGLHRVVRRLGRHWEALVVQHRRLQS